MWVVFLITTVIRCLGATKKKILTVSDSALKTREKREQGASVNQGSPAGGQGLLSGSVCELLPGRAAQKGDSSD